MLQLADKCCVWVALCGGLIYCLMGEFLAEKKSIHENCSEREEGIATEIFESETL
jgi:hypothetical protein